MEDGREDQKQGRKVGYLQCCKKEKGIDVWEMDVGTLQNEKHRSRHQTHNPDPFMVCFDGYHKGGSPSSMRSCVSCGFSLKTLDLWDSRADILALSRASFSNVALPEFSCLFLLMFTPHSYALSQSN